MRNVIVAWTGVDGYSFEQQVPLKFMGVMNRRLGFENKFDVLFLEGYPLLGKTYKDQLKELGFQLHDCSVLYDRLPARYNILRSFGDFEFKCFVRWLILEEYFSGERIIHYDGDVLFNIDPEKFARRVSGNTFVLQGCPAVTVISQREWLGKYREHLDRLVSDVKGYSEDAWRKRDGWENSLRTKWAGSRFRRVISSDQDLLSHLIHTDQILQDSPQSILSAMVDYILFENPLCVHETNDDGPFVYRRHRGIDYFNDRAVAFWHMQSDWLFYLSKFMNRFRYFPVFQSRRLQYDVYDFEDVMNRIVRKMSRGRSVSRLAVYEFFFNQYDFSGLLTDKVWWKSGIFV